MAKNFLTIITLLAFFSSVLTSCSHEHTWISANCTLPRTCSECGETEGMPLGHNYKEATCETAKTCYTCNSTEGSPLGHNYVRDVCTTCDQIAYMAESNQLYIAADVITDLENLENACNALTTVYQSAWCFYIYKVDSYYNFDNAVDGLSGYTGIESEYIKEATIDYVEFLGLTTSETICLAIFKGNVLEITERALELRGIFDYCGELVTSSTDNITKIHHKVIGQGLAEALVDYCNVVLNYYNFAKSPSGSYNSYSSNISMFYDYCINAKSILANEIDKRN